MAHDAQIASVLLQISPESASSPLKLSERQQLVDELVRLGEEHGMAKEELEKGYELALSGQLPTSTALSLLPALIPRSQLPLRPLLLTLSTLGVSSSQVDYKIQRRALEQLGVLLELGAVEKEGVEALEKMVEVVERGLEYRMLRKATAIILRLITRKTHIREFRTKALHSLISRLDSPPSSLLRLLEHYRSFQPEQVYEQRAQRWAKDGEREEELRGWREKVRAVLGKEMSREGEGEEGRESKRRRISAQSYIPLPTTYSSDLPSSSSVTLSRITSLSALSKNIDTLVLPSQAASVLSAVPGSSATSPSAIENEEDRSRAWAVLLRCGYDGDTEHLYRLSRWLISQLQHELHDLPPSSTGSARVEDLLCRMRELSEMGGELLEHFEPFVAEFLLTWDGKTHRSVVFDLVALLKPLEWDSLYGHFLRPLEALALNEKTEPEWVADFVGCLTGLVEHSGVRDDWDEGVSRATPFGQLDHNEPYLASLQSLLEFTDRLIASSTRRHPSSLTLRSSSFTFYETALSLPLDHNLPVVVFPSKTFTYTALVGGELGGVSRGCGLIVLLREALTAEKSAIARNAAASDDTNGNNNNGELVAALNNRLIDFVNAVWQRKFLVGEEAMGLSKEDLEALRGRAEERGQTTAQSMGVTVHPTMGRLAKEFFQTLAQEEGKSADGLVGPVTASSVKKLSQTDDPPSLSFTDFRPLFLQHLGKERGAEGLHDFLFGSLQSLIDRGVQPLGGRRTSTGP